MLLAAVGPRRLSGDREAGQHAGVRRTRRHGIHPDSRFGDLERHRLCDAGTPENKAALVTTVPMARLGFSEELANAIVFIASDEASFITGHVLNVDGGKSH